MKRVGYLSGSLRISTRFQAEEHGPCCHVLGTLSGLRCAGWEVFSYIVGDRVPLRWAAGLNLRPHPGPLKLLAFDLARLGSNRWHRRNAFLGAGADLDWVYERYGVFQSLGSPFQRRGIPWILETNTPFALENEHETARRSVYFRSAARRHERWAYQRCDALVVQTEALKDIVIDFARIEAAKVFVVPNAVDITRFQGPAMFRKFSGPTIGFVGALRRWQTLDALIRAIADLGRSGMTYNLVIIGEGEKRPEWQRLAQAVGVAGHVHFAGSVPLSQIPAWIAGFDIGFCGQSGSVAGRPMYFSPLKLYEYMAAAKPVLASDHADARRLVIADETGFLFEADSPASLQAGLRKAWLKRDSWPAMGLRAQRLIATGHTWEKRIGDAIVNLEGFLLQKGFRPPGTRAGTRSFSRPRP